MNVVIILDFSPTRYLPTQRASEYISYMHISLALYYGKFMCVLSVGLGHMYLLFSNHGEYVGRCYNFFL